MNDVGLVLPRQSPRSSSLIRSLMRSSASVVTDVRSVWDWNILNYQPPKPITMLGSPAAPAPEPQLALASARRPRKRAAPDAEAGASASAEEAVLRPAGRTRSFLRSHARKFALEVVGRDESTGAVTAALCLFCKHFGREGRPGKKRRPTAHFKYFRQSFRTDLYVQHHASQHPARWAEYDALPDDDDRKRAYFPAAPAPSRQDGREALAGDRLVAEAAAAARRSTDEHQLWFALPAAVVELLQPGPWAPAGFRACSRAAADQDQGRDRALYRVALFAREPLDLALDHFAAGVTAQQAARTIAATTTRSATGRGAPPATLATSGVDEMEALAQLTVASSLTNLGSVMASAMGFTLEIHSVRSTPITGLEGVEDVLLDVRVVVFVPALEDVHSFHLVAFPNAAARDAEKLGVAVVSLLDAMLPLGTWCGRLIAVASDGFGPQARASELAAWLCAHARSQSPHAVLPVRMWVVAPHVHLALDAFYTSMLDGEFIPEWRRLVALIQSHPGLVQEMGRPPSWSPAGGVHADKWLVLGRDAKWINDKRVRLRKTLEEHESDAVVTPSDSWWVAFFVVNWVASRADDAFARLRAYPQAATSAAAIAELAGEIAAAFRAQPPTSVVLNEDFKVSRAGRYAVSAANVREFADDLGLFVSNLVARIDAPALDKVLASVAQGIANFVDALVEVSGSVPPSEYHEFASFLLPVRPPELASLAGRDLDSRLSPLRHLLADEEVRDAVDQEHQALRRAASRSPLSPSAAAAAKSELARAWEPTDGKFPYLQALAGTVATASAASTRFGDLWECGLALPARAYGRVGGDGAPPKAGGPVASVVDLAVEAALHAQQFAQLEELTALPVNGEGERDAEV